MRPKRVAATAIRIEVGDDRQRGRALGATLALFSGGREIARHAGATGAQDIVRRVRGQLG